MKELEKIGNGEDYLLYMYAYFIVAGIIAYYFVNKSSIKYKLEVFFLAFYLMTGNINEFLTIKIPGMSLFEIQPQRFLFLMFSFLLFRYFLLSKDKNLLKNTWTLPWFKLILILYILFKTGSLINHAGQLGVGEVITETIHSVNILILLIAIPLIISKETLDILGKVVIIGAVFTSIVSLIQIGIDPLFMRVGDHRVAFGDLLRANGIFSAENYNSCYLITAIGWVLVTIKKEKTKFLLLILFSVGVLLTFHRMSYLILGLVLSIYFLAIEKIAWDKLITLGLSGLAILIFTFLVFQRDIMNSAVVQERLSQDVGGRVGYYTMVFDNIGDRPVFGFGGKDNPVYYEAMLQVTRERNRATGMTGGIHSSYLSTMFYFGIPAFIFFTAFVFLTIFYFARLSTYNLFYAIPLIVSMFYAIGSLTNSYLFSKFLAIFYAVHLALGLGVHKMKQNVENATHSKIPLQKYEGHLS